MKKMLNLKIYVDLQRRRSFSCFSSFENRHISYQQRLSVNFPQMKDEDTRSEEKKKNLLFCVISCNTVIFPTVISPSLFFRDETIHGSAR